MAASEHETESSVEEQMSSDKVNFRFPYQLG